MTFDIMTSQGANLYFPCNDRSRSERNTQGKFILPGGSLQLGIREEVGLTKEKIDMLQP